MHAPRSRTPLSKFIYKHLPFRSIRSPRDPSIPPPLPPPRPPPRDSCPFFVGSLVCSYRTRCCVSSRCAVACAQPDGRRMRGHGRVLARGAPRFVVSSRGFRSGSYTFPYNFGTRSCLLSEQISVNNHATKILDTLRRSTSNRVAPANSYARYTGERSSLVSFGRRMVKRRGKIIVRETLPRTDRISVTVPRNDRLDETKREPRFRRAKCRSTSTDRSGTKPVGCLGGNMDYIIIFTESRLIPQLPTVSFLTPYYGSGPLYVSITRLCHARKYRMEKTLHVEKKK